MLNVSRPIGTWNQTIGLHIPMVDIFQRRTDLSGLTLDSVQMPWPLYNYIHISESDNLTKIIQSDGMFPDVMDTLATQMGFTYTKTLPPDNAWGALNPTTGEWNGMVGMLARKEADIIVASLSVFLERSLVIDYSKVIYEDSITLNVMKPEGRIINIGAYLYVFTEQSWLVYMALLVTFSIVAAMIPFFKLESLHDKTDPEKFGCLNSIAFSCAAFIRMHYAGFRARRMGSRVLHWTLCISSLVFFAFYEGVLTSLMTANPRQADIKSFRDVLNNNLQMIVMKDSGSHDKLKFSKEGSILRKIYYQTMHERKDSTYSTLEDIKTALGKNPKFVHFGAQTALINYEKIQSLPILDALVDQLALGFQKNSEFTTLFDYHIIGLRERGVLNNIKRKWMPSNVLFQGNAHQILDAMPLDYENLAFPFLSCIVGILIAIATLVLELIYLFTTKC